VVATLFLSLSLSLSMGAYTAIRRRNKERELGMCVSCCKALFLWHLCSLDQKYSILADEKMI